MSTFAAGSTGVNSVTSFLSIGTIASQSVTSSALISYLSNGGESILYGSYSVSGGKITGGTVTGWTMTDSSGAQEWSITGINASVSTIAFDSQLGLNNSIALLILPPNSTYIGSSNPAASDMFVGIGGSDTYIGGAATEVFVPNNGTNSITGGTGLNTVKLYGPFYSYTVTNHGQGNIVVTDSMLSRNGINDISHVQKLQFTDVTVSVAADGSLITPAANVAQSLQWAKYSDVGTVTISDSAANVLSNLSALQTLAANRQIGTISLTDGGIPSLSITAAQATNDAAALNAISGSFSVTQTVPGGNQSIVGVTSASGNTLVLSGNASQYTVTPLGDGVHFTVTTGGSSDQVSNVQALKFSDFTEIVAPTPGTNGTVTGGNITELYGAVFGRIPDLPGLSYYEKQLAANPSLSLVSLAANFLQSPEYTGNSTHIYPQSAAGEAQFITDGYSNLLHRAPESGAIPYYQNLIGTFTQGLTPGTPAYAAAELKAHATVLVDFSGSAEFLGDVQVTAVKPASAGFTGHWLLLI